MNRLRFFIGLAFATVFAAGLVTGRLLANRPVPEERLLVGSTTDTQAATGNPGAEARTADLLRRFTLVLQIDATQQSALEPVLARAVRSAQNLGRRHESERRALIAQVDRELLPLLRPEQQAVILRLREEQPGRFFPLGTTEKPSP